MALPPHADKPAKQDSAGNPVYVPPRDLKPGDILLSYGDPDKSDVPWWIRKLDGGSFSHASFFDGTELVEAASSGVIVMPTAERVQGQRYTDVYRFRSDDGDELGSLGWEFEPVREAVRGYLGHPFAYHDLILSALLVIQRRINLPGNLEDRSRPLLSRAVRRLRELIQKEKKVHLVCSELVFRGFREATPKPRYRLRIPSRFAARLGRVRRVLTEAVPADDDTSTKAEVRRLEQEFAELYVSHKTGSYLKLDGHDLEPGPRAKRTEEDIEADYVTPYDLEQTRNLSEVGRARKQDYLWPL